MGHDSIGGGGGGDGADRGGGGAADICDGGAGAEGPALLSLRLPPEEAAYWRASGTPALATLDAWALLYTAFNVAMGYALTVNSAHATSMPSLVQRACDAGSLALFLLALALRAWLALDFKGYCRHRNAFAVVNRAARSVYMLVVFTQLSVDNGWRDFVLHQKPGGPPLQLVPSTAAAVLLKGLTHCSTYWVLHVLLFPFRLALAAPLHAAFCLAAWPAMRGFACMVYADPELQAGARLLCEQVQGINSLTLTMGGGPALAASGACSRRPMELLVPLSCALACLAPLLLLYEMELSHKLSYLRARAPGPSCAPAAEPHPMRRFAAVVALLPASFAAGEAAARGAPPVECAAS